MRIAAGGADVNILARAYAQNRSAIAFTPSASSKFPAKNAVDQNVTKIVQWNQVSGDSGDPENPDPALERSAIIDINLVKNPGAESGFRDWKKAPSTTAVSSSDQAVGGTKSFKVTGHATDLRYQYQDIPMLSDEYARLRFANYGGGGSVAAFVRVRDLNTGRYLQSGGTWADAAANLGSKTTTGWAAVTTNAFPFTVEPYGDGVTAAGTGKHNTMIRIELHAGGGVGNVYFDDVEMVVGCDGASVHGVGFPFQMAPTIYSSDTGAFAGEETSRFSMVPFHPSFYSLLASPVLARYWQFVLPGVREATFKPWLGELFLVQTVNLEHQTDSDFSSRYGSEIMHAWLDTKAGRASRSLKLPFRWFNDAWPQARERFILRTLGTKDEGGKAKKAKKGASNRRIWIVAPEFEAQMVIFGKMTGDIPYSLSSPGAADGGIVIVEDPFPAPLKGELI